MSEPLLTIYYTKFFVEFKIPQMISLFLIDLPIFLHVLTIPQQPRPRLRDPYKTYKLCQTFSKIVYTDLWSIAFKYPSTFLPHSWETQSNLKSGHITFMQIIFSSPGVIFNQNQEWEAHHQCIALYAPNNNKESVIYGRGLYYLVVFFACRWIMKTLRCWMPC
jgi:hypothetical protein